MRRSSRPDDPFILSETITISAAAGSHSINVFKLTGSVRVLDQIAEITEITTLTNCTAVYADLYDGTLATDLTANGVALSGLPVGTVFLKDKIAANTYTVCSAATGCVNETTDDRFAGRPFIVTAKDGADTYIRLNLTTTDDPISFKILLHFRWETIDGGALEFLL